MRNRGSRSRRCRLVRLRELGGTQLEVSANALRTQARIIVRRLGHGIKLAIEKGAELRKETRMGTKNNGALIRLIHDREVSDQEEQRPSRVRDGGRYGRICQLRPRPAARLPLPRSSRERRLVHSE